MSYALTLPELYLHLYMCWLMLQCQGFFSRVCS